MIRIVRIGTPAESANSENKNSFSYVAQGGGYLPIPSWTNWLIDLGSQLAQFSAQGKVWVCLTVPERRFCSSLIALGAIRQSVRSHHVIPPAERFVNVPVGCGVTWVDSHGMLRSGRFLGIESGKMTCRRRDPLAYQNPSSWPLESCGSFWPLNDGEEPFAGPRKLASSPGFVEACFGVSVRECCTRSSEDVLICGVKSELVEDLSEPDFSIGDNRGSLLDVIRPKDLLPQGQRSRSRVVSASSELLEIDQIVFNGLAIFDGAQSYLRLHEVVEAPVNVVVLGRWEPRSSDAAVSAMLERTYKWVDAPTPTFVKCPNTIETFAWAEDA